MVPKIVKRAGTLNRYLSVFTIFYRQRNHKDSTTSRGQAPFERKLSTRALQMSGDSIGSNALNDRKMSRLDPEHAVRKISQGN